MLVLLVGSVVAGLAAWSDAERRYEQCRMAGIALAQAGFYAVEGDMEEAANYIDLSIATGCELDKK